MVEDLHLSKKEFTKRVSITKNDNRSVISIKAPTFSWGNNFLTLMLSVGIVGEVIIAYLMVLKPSHIEYLFPLLIASTGIFIIVFTRMWLWHHFGEEYIEINGNQLTSNRKYALFSTPKISLAFNMTSQLYLNHEDAWDWKGFRKKGTLRLTSDNTTVDFGKGLDYQEYESITRLMASYIEKFKQVSPSSSINGNNMEAIPSGMEARPNVNKRPTPTLHKSA